MFYNLFLYRFSNEYLLTHHLNSIDTTKKIFSTSDKNLLINDNYVFENIDKYAIDDTNMLNDLFYESERLGNFVNERSFFFTNKYKQHDLTNYLNKLSGLPYEEIYLVTLQRKKIKALNLANFLKYDALFLDEMLGFREFDYAFKVTKLNQIETDGRLITAGTKCLDLREADLARIDYKFFFFLTRDYSDFLNNLLFKNSLIFSNYFYNTARSSYLSISNSHNIKTSFNKLLFFMPKLFFLY